MYNIKQIPGDFIVKEISNVKIKAHGKYSYFVMKKKNYSTVRAIMQIADKLRVPMKFIGFAGNKDKTAVTEQVISINSCRANNFKIKDIELELLGRGDEPISLGDLEGNRFEIVVRDVNKKPEKIGKFINYFGEQRFSKNNIPIGKSIIKKEFKKAVDLIINNEKNNEHFKKYIEKNKNDYVGLLRMIPKKTLKIYVHAFQSHIWNETVKKIKRETIPIVGFGTEFTDDDVEGVIDSLLEKEGINQRDFIIRAIPELSSDGDERKVYSKIKDLEISDLEEDEINKGKKKLKLKFSLGKGCYATEAIKALFQCS